MESQCQLCNSTDSLETYDVPPGTPAGEVTLCGTCRPQVTGDIDLDPSHWHCLQESAWSEVAPVQVVALRLLNQLRAETWAGDLLDMLYVPDEVQAWADTEAEAAVKVVDSNGEQLVTGDSVTLIKDLDVKGANFTAKRGTMVKNIRVGDDPSHVEGRVNKTAIYLKTEFIKKVR
jgi:protein PhnA